MEILLWAAIIMVGAAWVGIVLVGPPYVPTHQKQLDRLFKELELSSSSHVVDLGSGDGRILLAASRSGAKVTGIELNPFLIAIARFRLRHQRQTKVVFANIWQYKLPEDTTHVFVFLAHSLMPRLERYLEGQGKPVTLVSYGFELPNKTPSRVIGGFNVYEVQ